MAEEKKNNQKYPSSIFHAAHASASEHGKSGVSLFYTADEHKRGITTLAQACQPLQYPTSDCE